MKVSWHDLTPDEQAAFGNGCTIVPDFHYTASCRHHDWNYLVGKSLWDKIKADWGMCKAMWHDSHVWWHYVVTVVYWSGLTFLPFPYFFFRWGFRYLSKEEALLRDKLSKMRRGIM